MLGIIDPLTATNVDLRDIKVLLCFVYIEKAASRFKHREAKAGVGRRVDKAYNREAKLAGGGE